MQNNENSISQSQQSQSQSNQEPLSQSQYSQASQPQSQSNPEPPKEEVKKEEEKIEEVKKEESKNEEEKKEESKNEEEKKWYNPDYYDENGVLRYDDIVNYENNLRAEIELTTPLVSEKREIGFLQAEFSDSDFVNSTEIIASKYKYYRTTRRDGNCFYRGFLFRLFEEIFLNKNEELFKSLEKTIIDSKDYMLNNGYELMVIEDFYDVFLEELRNCHLYNNNTNGQNYLDNLFQNKDRCTYLIVYIRMYIAAFLKQNQILYECFVDDDYYSWIMREVEAIDRECDQIQIMAVVNAFNIGVIIENLMPTTVNTVVLPEDKNDAFIHLLYRPGHYDILYK